MNNNYGSGGTGVALAKYDAFHGVAPVQLSGGGATPVTSIYDGSSTSALLSGLMMNAAYEECPQAEFTGFAMEYGTLPLLEVMAALRGDHWLHRHPEAAPELADAIRVRMREAFYTDTDLWKGQVVSQARQACFQAVDGLAR